MVIGLLIGGVLVGQSLIKAAEVRAEVSQIDKYQTAVATFRDRFGALPGDIQPSLLTQFGFTASPTRSGITGAGDGNGEIDGNNGGLPYTWLQAGEPLFFWEDLSTNSHLVEGALSSVHGINGANNSCASITACSAYFPYAKIGTAFIYVYSGYANLCCVPNTEFGPNFFGLSSVNSVGTDGNVNHGTIPSGPALTVAQAYAIDMKIDDGMPTTGNVLAQFLGVVGDGRAGWSTNNSSPSPSTCYDTSSGTANYSIHYQNGSNVNCGISFKFQTGD